VDALALAVNGIAPYSAEFQERAVNRRQAAEWFGGWLNRMGVWGDGWICAGWNVGFDRGFLLDLLAECPGSFPRPAARVLDVQSVAMFARALEAEDEGWGEAEVMSMDECADWLGIARERRPHGALAGALQAVAVLRALGERCQRNKRNIRMMEEGAESRERVGSVEAGEGTTEEFYKRIMAGLERRAL
jgi:hypothetical protein